MNREEYHLPAVLSADLKRRESAGSVLRALKHIKDRLLENLPEGEISNADQVALDDLDFMIRRVM